MHYEKHKAWTKRAVVAAASIACGMLVASCNPPLGKCDMTQLGGVEMSGTVNVGQTVVNTHCASGRCHSALATGKLRVGAPAGFNFDAIVTGTTPGTATVDIVMRGIANIKENADWMWGQVDSGNMPPPKQGSITAMEKDQMRNWLACGAPAILAPQGGATTADWTSIYVGLTTATCFTCHGSGTLGNGMGFSLGDQGDQCAAYNMIVNKPSITPACMGKGLILVKPGDPANSFMLQKMGVGTLACGATMPFGAMPLNVTNPMLVASFQQWIMAGAPKPAACP